MIGRGLHAAGKRGRSRPQCLHTFASGKIASAQNGHLAKSPGFLACVGWITNTTMSAITVKNSPKMVKPNRE